MSSLYFEDFAVGQTFISGGRTITETDLTMFSMISGDWNPIHADAVYAAGTRYGQRVVHGTLGIAMATGMMHELGIFHQSAVAMTSINEWSFQLPLLVGDTIHLELEVLSLSEGKSQRMGNMERRLSIVNQRGDIVQTGISEILVLKRGHGIS